MSRRLLAKGARNWSYLLSLCALLSILATAAAAPLWLRGEWTPGVYLAAAMWVMGTTVLLIVTRPRRLSANAETLYWTARPGHYGSGRLALPQLTGLQVRPVDAYGFDASTRAPFGLVAHTESACEVVFVDDSEWLCIAAARALLAYCRDAPPNLEQPPHAAVASREDLRAWLRAPQKRALASVPPARPLLPRERQPPWLRPLSFAAFFGGGMLPAIAMFLPRAPNGLFIGVLVWAGVLYGTFRQRRDIERTQLLLTPLRDAIWSRVDELKHGEVAALTGVVLEPEEHHQSLLSGRECVLSTVSGFGTTRAPLGPSWKHAVATVAPRASLLCFTMRSGDRTVVVRADKASVVLPISETVAEGTSRFATLAAGPLERFVRYQVKEPLPTSFDDYSAKSGGERYAADPPIEESLLEVGDVVAVFGRFYLPNGGNPHTGEDGMYRQANRPQGQLFVDAELITMA